MDELEKVFETIDGYRNEAIRLQTELTSRVALGPANGGTGEHEKADFLKTELEGLNPDVLELFRAPEQEAEGGFRPNLVARWNGRLEGPAVWILSHMDVVPPGNPALWDGDPYRARVEGDRIVGRGVEDDQHGIVSSLLAIRGLQEAGAVLRRPAVLALVADEETGSRRGLGHLLKHHGDLFSSEDLIVVPDAGNETGTMIEVAEKSVLWLRFTVKGTSCHASTPQKGRNSLVGAAHLIQALVDLEVLFEGQDPLFHPPVSTFVPTKMEANVPNINTLPGRDAFHMDCRVLPPYSLDRVIAAAREISERIASDRDIHVEVEVVHRDDAAPPTDAKAPVVQALKRSIRRVNGRDAEPVGIGGGTVAALFRRAGLPAAVWMTAQDTAHQANEYCLISDLIQDAKVFACLLLEETTA